MKASKAAFVLIIWASLAIPLRSAENARVSWVMDEVYTGSHQDSFNKLRYEVPIIMRQTLIDLAVRCGLDFQEGWQFPFVVRFDDGAPHGVENILAYVRMQSSDRGELRQELVVNLDAYDQQGFDFDKVFAHELVHAMLNDALGASSLELPTWYHEGLAVYGANQGEQVMQSYVSQAPDANESRFFNGLEGPHGAIDYLEDYLAFKYVHDAHGVNALHALVRETINRKGDVKAAIESACQESWEKFQENARAFGERQVFDVSRSLHGMRSDRPY